MKFTIKKENNIYKIINEDTGEEYGRETNVIDARKLLKYTIWLFTTDVKPHDSFCNSKLKEYMDQPCND